MECSPVAMLPINSPKVKKKRYVINLSWNPSTGVKRTPAVFPARPNYHNKATTLWDFLLPPWSFIFPRRKTLGLGRTEFKMKPHNKALPHQGTHSIPLKEKEKPRTRSTHEGQIWAFSTSPKFPWPGLGSSIPACWWPPVNLGNNSRIFTVFTAADTSVGQFE